MRRGIVIHQSLSLSHASIVEQAPAALAALGLYYARPPTDRARLFFFGENRQTTKYCYNRAPERCVVPLDSLHFEQHS